MLKKIADLETGDIVMNEYDKLAEITEIEEPGLFRCIDINDMPNVIDMRELVNSPDESERYIETFSEEEFEASADDDENDEKDEDDDE